MKRHHDWQVRLEAFLRERRSMPFAWGLNDCTVFAADCVEALTGVRHLPDMRNYANEKQAARLMRKHGGLIGIASAALGEPIPALMAGIGDVVLSKAGDRAMLAICNGGTCMAPGAYGLAHMSMSTATIAWRVG